MSEHVYNISGIVSPVEQGQRPEHSAAVITVIPPFEVGEAFIPSVIGQSHNANVQHLGTIPGRQTTVGKKESGGTSFVAEVGGNHYNEAARENALHAIAQRICKLANDPMIAVEMRADNPVPHRPLS